MVFALEIALLTMLLRSPKQAHFQRLANYAVSDLSLSEESLHALHLATLASEKSTFIIPGRKKSQVAFIVAKVRHLLFIHGAV